MQLNARMCRKHSVDSIYLELKRRMLTAELPPGQVVYEGALSREFGLSRTPIRTVLNRLQRDGLVETRRGFGNTVTEIDYSAFQDVYRLRVRMAELIGEFADVERIDDATRRLNDVEKALEALNSEKLDYKALSAANIWLVETALLLLEGTVLHEITDMLFVRTARIWHLAIPFLDWSEEVDAAASEAREALRALNERDIGTYGLVRRNFTMLAFRRIARHPQLFECG